MPAAIVVLLSAAAMAPLARLTAKVDALVAAGGKEVTPAALEGRWELVFSSAPRGVCSGTFGSAGGLGVRISSVGAAAAAGGE